MPPEQKHPRHPVAQAFSTLGTLMSLWITEDTIPVQKQYANLFTVVIWSLQTGLQQHLTQLASLY